MAQADARSFKFISYMYISPDCIEGVAGIGAKGAAALIAQFSNLDAIYKDAGLHSKVHV